MLLLYNTIQYKRLDLRENVPNMAQNNALPGRLRPGSRGAYSKYSYGTRPADSILPNGKELEEVVTFGLVEVSPDGLVQ